MPHLSLPASEREGFWHVHARRLLSGNLGSLRARGGGHEHVLYYVRLLSRLLFEWLAMCGSPSVKAGLAGEAVLPQCGHPTSLATS